MEKTDTFFLIHNFNTVPEELLEYCNDYLIMDASNDENVIRELDEKKWNVCHIPNTGHNITSYFSYFADHYDDLPEVMCLCKGNMIGRHCSKEYFDSVYRNTWFTYLYEEKNMRPRYSKATEKTLSENNGKDPSEGSIALLVSQSRYIEENSSWYMGTGTHPYRYFDNFDDLLCFMYQDPVIPKYVMFSPGACYIVRREQVQKHSPAFYRNLNKLQNYTIDPAFPAEAYIIERLLPVIFEENYAVCDVMEDEAAFETMLPGLEEALKEKHAQDGRRFKRLRRLLGK